MEQPSPPATPFARTPEEYVEVLVRGQLLRGILHHARAAEAPAPLVAIWHGFTGNKIEPHRLLVGIARRLASRGIAAVRFDFWGSGESDGLFQNASPATEIEDAHAVLAWARQSCRFDNARLGLLGLSIGGWVSACTAGQDRNVRALCLWAAPTRFADRIEAGLSPEQRAQRASRGWWDSNGNRVNGEFLNIGRQFEAPDIALGHSGATMVIHGECDEVVPFDHAHEWAQKLGAPLHVVRGGDHTFNGAGWEDDLFDATETFLGARCGEVGAASTCRGQNL
jgi:alpha/beta superfamily hydrolase